MGALEEAKKLVKVSPVKAEALLKEIIATKPGVNEEAMKEYELALMELGGLYRDSRFVFIAAKGDTSCWVIGSSGVNMKLPSLGEPTNWQN